MICGCEDADGSPTTTLTATSTTTTTTTYVPGVCNGVPIKINTTNIPKTDPATEPLLVLELLPDESAVTDRLESLFRAVATVVVIVVVLLVAFV